MRLLFVGFGTVAQGLSELLIEREVLDFEDVDAIMKTGKLPPGKEAVAQESAPAEETAATVSGEPGIDLSPPGPDSADNPA